MDRNISRRKKSIGFLLPVNDDRTNDLFCLLLPALTRPHQSRETTVCKANFPFVFFILLFTRRQHLVFWLLLSMVCLSVQYYHYCTVCVQHGLQLLVTTNLRLALKKVLLLPFHTVISKRTKLWNKRDLLNLWQVLRIVYEKPRARCVHSLSCQTTQCGVGM